jgi:radical SAM superfamily enzyme YgiQ (UPF0313 family)
MLSAALTQHGHEVRVLDYAYLREAERDADAVRAQLLAFRPDCVGVSVYTASVSLARETMRQAKELLGVPIIVGGPHATLYPEAMIGLDYVDTVVTGDGEVTLPLVVSEPARYAKQIVQGGQLDITTLPTADFSTFYGSERILIYPLQTSRGCPFNCSFCTVHTVTSRRWRPRDLQPVMAELDGALERLPQIREIQIHDDCPTLDVGRFKELLRQVAARQTARKLTVANIRADSVDDELVSLMLQAGCDSVCIAAEHGNPDVFDLIGKAETLADIERAATTIRRHGARLGLCFIIGLPGDTLARTQDSIRLARRLQPDFVFWNMAHPFRHSRILDWYEAHGATLGDVDDYASYVESSVTGAEPIVSTPEFTAAERRQAKFQCAVATDQYDASQEGVLKLLALACGYHCVALTLASLGRKARAAAWLRVGWRLRRLRALFRGHGGRAR